MLIVIFLSAAIASWISDDLASPLFGSRLLLLLVPRRLIRHPSAPCRRALPQFSPPLCVPVQQVQTGRLFGIVLLASDRRGRSGKRARWQGVQIGAGRLDASAGQDGLRARPLASSMSRGGATSAAPPAAPPAAGAPPLSVFAARPLEPGVLAPEPGSSCSARACFALFDGWRRPLLI